MCLQIINPKLKTITTGYKVFHQTPDGKLRGEIKNTNKVRPINRWLKASDYGRPITLGGFYLNNYNYPSGWHVFHSKKAAKDWLYGSNPNMVIKKVKVRKVTTKGRQGTVNCSVCKEILILPEGRQ